MYVGGMSFRSDRLRIGEWLLGAGSVLLLIDLFGLTWFEYRPAFHATATMLGQRVTANGWDTFEVIGPLTLVVCAAGMAIFVFTASRRSPALPVVISTLLAPVSFTLAGLIAIRVLLDQPTVHLAQAGGANVIDTRPGAYIGLVLGVLLFAGNYTALRREGVAPRDSPSQIETLSIEQSPSSARA
jgi:hypothetical protein